MPSSDDKEKVENEENERNDISDTKSNKSDKSDKSDKSKDTPKKSKGKKGADKMDPTRFQAGGVNFKAKLIGVENVPDARGDKMCQEAMQKLKGMVKSAKAHKQKITVNVSLEGLKIIDEISQNVVHHHAVHKISFISRDITDARAFGYVYGLGEGKHQFFGIKTDRPAEGLVLTLRDLFQVVFEMKKQEVEAAKARKQRGDEKKEERAAEKSASDQPLTQTVEGAYDTNFKAMLFENLLDVNRQGANTEEGSGGEKKDEKPKQSPSSANLLDLENQLLNIEVTFEQVDAFAPPGGVTSGVAVPTTHGQATSSVQFPVNFDNPPATQTAVPKSPALQRDPFVTQPQPTPFLAPPPSFGGQHGFQQPQRDPFVTDPFTTNQFGQPGFGAQPQAPPPQQQQQAFPAFPGQLPPQPQQPPQQASPQPGAFRTSPVQKDPFKEDLFFKQPDPNDRYAAFSAVAAPVATQSASGFGAASLQPVQQGPTAGQPPPASPGQQRHQTPAVPTTFSDQAFSNLASITGLPAQGTYVDKTQFFKEAEPPKPTLAQMAPQQVGIVGSEVVHGSSPHRSRQRPRPAQSDPFNGSPATDPFGSAPFTQPTSHYSRQEVDPFDTSAVLAKSFFQGPFDTSELKPASAMSAAKPHGLDISASSSTPPTTRSDKPGQEGTTSSNVSTPEDFSLPSPEVPPPPLPNQGTVELPEEAPAPPPRPSLSSSSRPSMSRQATIDMGSMMRRGKLETSKMTRQTTIDFTEESQPPALPPRPPSSGAVPVEHVSSSQDPPPPHYTPPPLPRHDGHQALAYQSRTLPRQNTVPAKAHSQAFQGSATLSRQSTLPHATFKETPTRQVTPPLASQQTASFQDTWQGTPPIMTQQDLFAFPPNESFPKQSTPPPFHATFPRQGASPAFPHQDMFSGQGTPPASPRLVASRSTPPANQPTPPTAVRHDSTSHTHQGTPPSVAFQDSHSLGHPSPSQSPTSRASHSPTTGTSMMARPRPRPRPRTPASSQHSPTLSQLPEHAQSPPTTATFPETFSREVHTRHSDRVPTAETFTRDTHARQSDRTDAQTAARRVDNTKALLRNHSEPVFSVLATETITLPPEKPKRERCDSSGSGQGTSETSETKSGSQADPFPEGVDPFVDDSPIDPFSENDPFNNDLNQQAVAFRTKAIGSKDSESHKDSVSEVPQEDPFANDPFFTQSGKGTPVTSSPALSRQGRKQSRESDSGRSRTTSERSTSESQHDTSLDPFSTVPMKRNDSKTRSDSSSVHSSSTPDPFVVDWGSGKVENTSYQGSQEGKADTFQGSESHGTGAFKDQSNLSSTSDLGEVQQSKPTNGSDPFDAPVNGVSDSESMRSDSASLHSDPFASLDPFKFAFGGKKEQTTTWHQTGTSSQVFRSDSQTQSPFHDPFDVSQTGSVNTGKQAEYDSPRFASRGVGKSVGGAEGSLGSTTSDDNPFSSSPQPMNGGAPPAVPARHFASNPFATQNQWPQ